ncbi:MAG: Hpt domain-containing protein [Chloroflexi bacterium]|nr:Hpt domain-containing protein [Chloroflexota bacterium]
MFLEVIDARAFDQFVALWGEDAGEIIEEIVTLFLRSAPRMMEEMEQALEQGNLKELRRLAHSLKANSATVGAHRMANLCQRLEDAAEVGQVEEAAQLLAQVREEFPLVEGALENVLFTFGRLPSPSE